LKGGRVFAISNDHAGSAFARALKVGATGGLHAGAAKRMGDKKPPGMAAAMDSWGARGAGCTKA